MVKRTSIPTHTGLGTGSLSLREVQTEDLAIFFAHQLDPAAKDNVASIRVLEKCRFTIQGEDRGFANARGQEIEEFILKLTG